MSPPDASSLLQASHSLLPNSHMLVDTALERAAAELSNRAAAELSNAPPGSYAVASGWRARVHSDLQDLVADHLAPSQYRYGAVNYEDPNYNVQLPVFAIHGNLDEPGGEGGECRPDLMYDLSFTTLPAYCLLPTAYYLLPTTFCLPPTAYHLLPTAYYLLPTYYRFTAGLNPYF